MDYAAFLESAEAKVLLSSIKATIDAVLRERDYYRNALKAAIPLGITAGGARTVLEYGDMIRRGEV